MSNLPELNERPVFQARVASMHAFLRKDGDVALGDLCDFEYQTIKFLVGRGLLEQHSSFVTDPFWGRRPIDYVKLRDRKGVE